MRFFALASFATLFLGCAALAAGSLDRALVPVTKISLPGGATRLDYQSIDSARRLLFIAHLGDGVVDVIDLRTNAVRAVIPGIDRVHGVLAIPSLGRVYASATGTNEVVAIDEGTLRITARAPAGVYPDGLAFANPEHKLYISDERGRTVTAIDIHTNQRVATIELGGEAGNVQYDSVSDRVLVNSQTSRELVEIDPHVDKIVKRTHLSGCESNHGLSLSESMRIAYIACEDNAALLTVNLDSVSVTSTEKVGDTPDVLALDMQRHRLYVAAESGVVAVFAVGRSGLLKPIGMALLASNAHSVAVDPTTGYTYFPIEQGGNGPVLLVFAPTK